ncbi:MAG TPA: GNAT family N-acetyltransferase [Microlunatus sp.]|nr:GNAT family N-acetyltransferase [Microlunatus sp.]
MITVRAAVGEDVDAVWPLARDLATSYAVDHEAYARDFVTLVADPTVVLLVATDDGVVVGYLLGQRHVTFHAGGPVIWVEELMVAETRRGAGVGRALMRVVEERGRASGAAYLALATRRAAGFYAALGYEESAAYLKKALGTP